MKAGIGYCNQKNAFQAGAQVAGQIRDGAQISRPDMLFAFCSNAVDSREYVRGLRSVLGPHIPIVGGSAVGTITNAQISYEGYPAGALAIECDRVTFRIACVAGLDEGGKLAGQKLATELQADSRNRLLLIFYDSIRRAPGQNLPPLLNASSPLLAGLNEHLPPDLPVLGAGLLGDYGFHDTVQFCGSAVASQSVVGVLFGGELSPYFCITHGCTPIDGVYRRITKISGDVIHEIDGRPVVPLIDDLYGNSEWRRDNPVNLLSIGANHGERFGEVSEGNYVIRLITGVLPQGDGICLFEPDFKAGDEILFMLRDTQELITSTRSNARRLLHQIRADSRRPFFGMYIDCAGRAAQYANTQTEEAAEIQDIFNQADCPLFGFYSGVEIAPFLTKSRGLDWTGVLIVFAGE